MLKCPRLDWQSNSEKDVNDQVADLLKHYEETHGDGLPQDARELMKACANALGGVRATK